MHQSSIPSESRWSHGFRQFLEKFPSTRRTYSFEEVSRRLKADDVRDPRTAAVHAAAARTGLWSSLVSEKVRAELGPAATRLPTIVHWYRQGIPAAEIGRRLSPFGGAWDADHALAVAAALIAYILNQGG
jgi:hypothetical protein